MSFIAVRETGIRIVIPLIVLKWKMHFCRELCNARAPQRLFFVDMGKKTAQGSAVSSTVLHTASSLHFSLTGKVLVQPYHVLF